MCNEMNAFEISSKYKTLQKNYPDKNGSRQVTMKKAQTTDGTLPSINGDHWPKKSQECPQLRWGDDIKKIGGFNWMQRARRGDTWRCLETYVQHWTNWL